MNEVRKRSPMHADGEQKGPDTTQDAKKEDQDIRMKSKSKFRDLKVNVENLCAFKEQLAQHKGRNLESQQSYQ